MRISKFFRQLLPGDTLIEVMIAMAVFGAIIISTIGIMNYGLQSSEATIEQSMARNAMDVQAESIRYIANAYSSELLLSTGAYEYKNIWANLASYAITPNDFKDNYHYGSVNCANYYNAAAGDSEASNVISGNNFIINPHKLDVASISGVTNFASSGIIVPSDAVNNHQNIFIDAPLYPRIIFENDASASMIDEGNRSTLKQVEGIWITAVCSSDGTSALHGTCNSYSASNGPTYYDFYIRTCWLAPGATAATTLATTVRVENPLRLATKPL